MSDFEKFMQFVALYLAALGNPNISHGALRQARCLKTMFDKPQRGRSVEKLAWEFAEYHAEYEPNQPRWLALELE
jgi:hypothetical protein